LAPGGQQFLSWTSDLVTRQKIQHKFPWDLNGKKMSQKSKFCSPSTNQLTPYTYFNGTLKWHHYTIRLDELQQTNVSSKVATWINHKIRNFLFSHNRKVYHILVWRVHKSPLASTLQHG
jgi:hypothetical protein